MGLYLVVVFVRFIWSYTINTEWLSYLTTIKLFNTSVKWLTWQNIICLVTTTDTLTNNICVRVGALFISFVNIYSVITHFMILCTAMCLDLNLILKIIVRYKIKKTITRLIEASNPPRVQYKEHNWTLTHS